MLTQVKKVSMLCARACWKRCKPHALKHSGNMQ
jgi:hypothetical protein